MQTDRVSRKLSFIFWVQFGLVVVASTHYLTMAFFLVPILVGIFFAMAYFSSLIIKRDIIHFFFALLTLGYLFRSSVNELFLTVEFWKDLVLIIYNYAMVRLLSNYKATNSDFRVILIVMSLMALYFLVGRVVGIDVLELSKVIFVGSSYHIIAWFGLVLVGLVVSSYGASSKSNQIIVVYLILCMLLGGRTGVFMAFLLLAVSLSVGRKQSISPLKLVGAGVVIASLIGLIVSAGDGIFKDVIQRGASLGPREFIWLCYFNELNWQSFLLGFDKSLVNECVKPYIGRTTVESSFFSLQVLTGVFSVFILITLFWKVLGFAKVNILYFTVLVCFCFRMATGEFVFITVFDWLFLIVLFNKNVLRSKVGEKNNYGFR